MQDLTLVLGTTNAFIFQIVDSLIESWGVRLTCLDFNLSRMKETCLVKFKQEMKTNTDEFGKPLHHGIFDGFWWAFVTMSTVG